MPGGVEQSGALSQRDHFALLLTRDGRFDLGGDLESNVRAAPENNSPDIVLQVDPNAYSVRINACRVRNPEAPACAVRHGSSPTAARKLTASVCDNGMTRLSRSDVNSGKQPLKPISVLSIETCGTQSLTLRQPVSGDGL